MDDKLRAITNNREQSNVWLVIQDNKKFIIPAKMNKIAVRISRNKPLTVDLIDILKE